MKPFCVVVMNSGFQPDLKFFDTDTQAFEFARENFKNTYNKSYVFNVMDPKNPRKIFWS